MQTSDHLFVFGCARSGTSALGNVLSEQPQIALGMERYINLLMRESRLDPALFQPERFFSMQPDDTFYASLEALDDYYPKLEAKYSSVRYRGDKIPRLYRYLPQLMRDFPGAKFVFILRNLIDTAASFQVRAEAAEFWPSARDAIAAVDDWNEALASTAPYIRNGQVLCVLYEDLFEYGVGWDRVAQYLELDDFAAPVIRPKSDRGIRLSSDAKVRIQLDGRGDLYREMIGLARAPVPITRPAPARPTPAAPATPPTATEPAPSPPAAAPRSAWVAPPAWRKYQDAPVIDYPYTGVEGLSFAVRTVGGAIPEHPDLAFLGSAASFGRFIDSPFADRIAEQTGRSALNLGFGGARPETYLREPKAVEMLRNTRHAVIEVMSARGYETAIFRPFSHLTNGGEVKAGPSLTGMTPGQQVFVDWVWTAAFASLPADEIAGMVADIQARYLADMAALAALPGSCEFLFIAQKEPPASIDKANYRFPHLITEKVLADLATIAPVRRLVSNTGVPQELRNRETGEPVPLMDGWPNPSLNAYYPTPEMHVEAAALLVPTLPPNG